MPNSRYQNGRRGEYRVMRPLEAQGYQCVRAAGSHGAADVIAWNGKRVRFVSVKCGSAGLSASERAALATLPVPTNVTREVWAARSVQGASDWADHLAAKLHKAVHLSNGLKQSTGHDLR